MTWPMLCAFITVLLIMSSDILYALKADTAARKHIALAIVFSAMAIDIVKGWI